MKRKFTITNINLIPTPPSSAAVLTLQQPIQQQQHETDDYTAAVVDSSDDTDDQPPHKRHRPTTMTTTTAPTSTDNNNNNGRSVHLKIRTDYRHNNNTIELNSTFSVTLSHRTREYWDALVAIVVCANDNEDFSRLTYSHVKLPLILHQKYQQQQQQNQQKQKQQKSQKHKNQSSPLVLNNELELLIQHAEKCRSSNNSSNHNFMFGSTGVIYHNQQQQNQQQQNQNQKNDQKTSHCSTTHSSSLSSSSSHGLLIDSSLIILMAKFAQCHFQIVRMSLSQMNDRKSCAMTCTTCLEQLSSCHYTKPIEQLIQQNLMALFYHLRGWFCFCSNAQQAVLDYSKALEIRRDYAVAFNNRAVLLESLHEFQKAMADYSKAIELEPGYSKAYYNRSLLLEAMSEFVLSLRDAAMAYRLEPTDKDMQAHYHQLQKKVRAINSCPL